MSPVSCIQIDIIHELYETHEHRDHQRLLKIEDHNRYKTSKRYLDFNIPFSAIRKMWQNVVSSDVGAHLVSVEVSRYTDLEELRNVVWEEFLEEDENHEDGGPFTISDLASLTNPNWFQTGPDEFLIEMRFEYVMDDGIEPLRPGAFEYCLKHFRK